MHHKKTILFLILSTTFAATHYFAVLAYLYWYYWWFDIFMHFWGGALIGLGVYTFCTFSRIHLRPSLGLVLFTLAIVTSSWEVFEWSAGLWDQESYLVDTVQDVIVGFSGGLLTHIVLSKRTIRS